MPSRWTDLAAHRVEGTARLDAPLGPGDRTDRFALPGHTRYLPRVGYAVARTPERPDYAHGHRLLLEEPPEPGTLAQWVEIWRREQRDHATCDLAIFQFEAPSLAWMRRAAPARTLWLRSMACEGLPAAVPTPRREVEFGEISPDDAARWDEASRLSVAVNEIDPDLTRWMYQTWRARAQAGEGALYGWTDPRRGLVASCAAFWRDGEARFQDVSVHPGFQQLGLGSSLVARTLVALQTSGRSRDAAWVVCEQEGHAERMYARLGFRAQSELGEVAVSVRPGRRRGER